MVGKCLELDNWSVFHMAFRVACFIVFTVEKAMINEDGRQEHKLHVELCRFIVETHLGHFWNVFFYLHLCMSP